MRDLEDEDGYGYDYSPNELAQLSIDNNKEYRRIVGQHVDNIEQWQANNLREMQKHLNKQ